MLSLEDGNHKSCLTGHIGDLFVNSATFIIKEEMENILWMKNINVEILIKHIKWPYYNIYYLMVIILKLLLFKTLTTILITVKVTV